MADTDFPRCAETHVKPGRVQHVARAVLGVHKEGIVSRVRCKARDIHLCVVQREGGDETGAASAARQPGSRERTRSFFSAKGPAGWGAVATA